MSKTGKHLIYLNQFLPPRETNIINYEKIYGIKNPFYISNLEHDHENEEVHVYIEYHRHTRFFSSCCAGKDRSAIFQIQPRTWRTLDTYLYKTFIHMDVPFVKCPICGSVKEVNVPCSTKWSDITIKMSKKPAHTLN